MFFKNQYLKTLRRNSEPRLTVLFVMQIPSASVKKSQVGG